MDIVHLRAWWHARQGLDGRLNGLAPDEVLRRTGWARSVGGANPYLQIFARCGARRDVIDAEVAVTRISELPSARGCTYVLGSHDFADGLTCGQGFVTKPELDGARKFLDYTDEEFERLCAAVLDHLDRETLDPKDLRSRLGDLVRNFGDAGKKRGLTTSLPLALGYLQEVGQILRVPEDGRLDRQRYAYRRWHDGPFVQGAVDRAEAMARLCDRFFGWIGPARIAEFQKFGGLGVAATKAAVGASSLVAIDESKEWWIRAEDLEEFQSFEAPSAPSYALVGSIDGLFNHRRSVVEHVESVDRERETVGERESFQVGSISELSNHAIVDRGRLIGVWEFDPDAGELIADVWIPIDDQLLAVIDRTAEFIRTDLGDARSFSLDSPKGRTPKLTALRSRGIVR